MILRNLSPFGDVIKLIKTSKRLQDMFTMNSLRKSKNALSNLKEEGFLHEKEFINIFIPYKEEEKETIQEFLHNGEGGTKELKRKNDNTNDLDSDDSSIDYVTENIKEIVEFFLPKPRVFIKDKFECNDQNVMLDFF